jgi:hypothetical protein
MPDPPRYVQYGCGLSAPAQWRNFDASPTLRFERLPLVGKLYSRNQERFPENVEYGDIVKGLPVAEQSCRAVYCSHVLEHLALRDFRLALKNTLRLLEPGCPFRLVVPDLEFFIAQYRARTGPGAAPAFMENTGLGCHSRPRGLKGMLLQSLGNSSHLWMWDFKSLARELETAGFTQVRRARFGDSDEERFSLVEEEGRWTDCLGMECKRPGA